MGQRTVIKFAEATGHRFLGRNPFPAENSASGKTHIGIILVSGKKNRTSQNRTCPKFEGTKP